MIHPSVAASAAALAIAAIVASIWRVLSRSARSKTMRRLGLTDVKARGERVLLASLSERLLRTAIGRWMHRYSARNHPQVPFSDVIAWSICGLLAGLMIGALLFPRSPLLFVCMGAGPAVIDRVGRARGARSRRRLEEELPEALQLQVSALRAGHSTARSLAILASELHGPLGGQMASVVHSIEMGQPLEAALGALSHRLKSRDVDLWVTAMTVHRITGGNLTVVLDSLSDRIRERQQLKAEVRALTAQGRMSGAVVAAAPAAFFILLSITSREQMQILFTTGIGMALLASGLAMQALGFLWIRRILRVRA